MKRLPLYLFSALVLVTGTVAASPMMNGDTSEVRLGTDRYVAGQDIQITDDVAGDVIVAAGSVRITGNVKGDLIVFARSVTIDGDVAGSVRGAAQNFNLNGSVGNKITVAGQDVQVNAGNAATAGSVALAGQTVVLDRPLAGYAMVASETASLNSSVDGPVRLATSTVTLGQDAAFPSGVTFQKVNNDEAANTSINALRQVTQVNVVEAPISTTVKPVSSFATTFTGTLTFGLELLILGLVVLWLVPGLMTTVVEAERGNPWLIVIFGLLGLPLYVILTITLIISFIFTPVGIMMLFAAPLLLTLSYLAFLINVGHLVTRRRDGKTPSAVGLLVIGTAVIFVLNLIPLVGLVAGIVAYFVSTGVWWIIFLRKVHALK